MAMSGSMMVRVCTAAMSVRKISMPSRKKGRFSSKKMGKRWFAVLTVAVNPDFAQVEVNFDGLVDELASVCHAERACEGPAHRADVLARLRDCEAWDEFDCALGRDVFEARDVTGLVERSRR